MSEFEEKVLKILDTINDKLDKFLSSKSTTAASTATEEKAIPKTVESVKPSVVVDKQEEEEKMKEKPPIEGRLVCPQCGGTAFKEQEDKTQIIHQMGGIKIYKKLKICKNCGYQAN